MLSKIFFLSILICCITTCQGTKEYEAREPFYLEEIINNSFADRNWNGTWISDDTFVYQDGKGDYYKVKADTLKKELILKDDVLKTYPNRSVVFSPDLNYALIQHTTEKGFPVLKTTSQYSVLDIKRNKYYDLANKHQLRIVHWSPIGNKLVYVLNDDVYYLRNPESVSTPIQITNDGIPDTIANGFNYYRYGSATQLYGSTIRFSPEGNSFAFFSCNYSEVKESRYVVYEKPGADNQYTHIIKQRYTVAKTPFARITICIINLEDDHKRFSMSKITLPSGNSCTEPSMLMGLKWESNVLFSYTLANRVRDIYVTNVLNKTDLHKLKTVEVKYDPRENSSRGGWLEEDLPMFNRDLTKYYIISYQPEGNDSYGHLTLVEEDKPKRLTKGERVVQNVYGWDENRNLIFYASTVEGRPYSLQTYVFDLNTGTDKCLTCNFETPEGLCKYSETEFSKDFTYFANICKGPGPTVIRIQKIEDTSFCVWEDNRDLRRKLVHKLKPNIKEFKVKLQSGYFALVRMLMPPDLNENGLKKYPMVVDVYTAMINFSRIVDKYEVSIADYFVTNRNYVYVYIDGRGFGCSGNNMKFEVYEGLGTVDLDDQIEVTKILLKKYSFIDANRIGVWGVSYGGFDTVGLLIKDTQGIFKFGFAVSGVYNFVKINVFCLEKYMGCTENNMELYLNTDYTRKVEALRNKTLFLVHSNADSNVLYQHAMILAKALQNANILYYEQSYPDYDHDLSEKSSHFLYALDSFFYQQLSYN